MTLDTVDRVMVDAAAMLEADLATLLDRVRADAAYGDYVANYPARPGRALRPALGMASTLGHGGDAQGPSRIVMTALEILHNAFLVHDDLEDGSLMRRGEPCLHRMFGNAAAVHAGDSLVVLALRQLDVLAPSLGWPKVATLRSLFEGAMTTVVEGQGLEINAYQQSLARLDEQTYTDIVARKTAAYTTIFPIMSGALLGSWECGRKPNWDALKDYGLITGLLFQVVDDIKNFEGSILGKSPDDDLHEGKLTPLLFLGWRAGNEAQRSRVEQFYEAGPHARSDDWCQDIAGLLSALQAPVMARLLSDRLATAAERTADRAFTKCVDRTAIEFFAALPSWLTGQLDEGTT